MLEEAEPKEKQEAERKAKAEAERKAQAERKAKEEEAARKQKEQEAEERRRQAKREAQRRRLEAERKAKEEEAARKQKEQAERKAKAEAERKAQEDELHFYRKLQAARTDGGSPVEVSALRMEGWMEACALPVASTDSVLPEDRLEGNRRRDFLGQGGFGTVYKGKFFCPLERKDVWLAVKKTSPFLTLPEAEAQEQQRSLHDCLLREVRVLSGLQHAHVIRLYAFSEPKSAPVEGGFPRMYLAYELCSGGTLADSLRSDDLAAQLSWDKRLALVLGVAQALVYLHNPAHGRATIFHRDVKPQNIALGVGEWPAPKLIDCGLARYIPSHDSKLSHHSKTGQVFGTPGYQCPEYLSDPAVFDATSEVFSFGVVLAEVFTGRLQNQHVDGQKTNLRSATMKKLPCDARVAPWPAAAMSAWRKLAQDCLEAYRDERKEAGAADMSLVLARLQKIHHLSVNASAEERLEVAVDTILDALPVQPR